MALPIHQRLFTDAGLNSGASTATGPGLQLQNGSFTFRCKPLAQTRNVGGVEVEKKHRTQDKNYKNNVPRELFTALTKPLFDFASRMLPGFPQLPKFAIMHVHNRTNKELLNLLGLGVKFVSKSEYDRNRDGISAVISAPQVSPIPFHGEYTNNGAENARKFLFEKSLKHRGAAGSQFLNDVEDWLSNNPQQSPLAQYFTGQQAQIQQQPPQPSVTQATAFNFAAPNPPVNVGVPQVSQPYLAAVNHSAQYLQPPQTFGGQAAAVPLAASNAQNNFGAYQVSQPDPAAATYPPPQMQLQQPVWSQAATATSATPNAYGSFGASQVNQDSPVEMRMAHALAQEGYGQAASFNPVAPNAPVNFGAVQPGQAAMVYAAQQMPAQQMPAPQPDPDQGNSISPMDSLSPMKSDYGAGLPSMSPFAHVGGGVGGMDQAGPASMKVLSAGMGQESLDSTVPPATIDPRILLVDEVGDVPGPSEADLAFQDLPPEQRARLHSVASGSMPPQPHSFQATEVAPRDPGRLQELGGDQSSAQTSHFGVTDNPGLAGVDTSICDDLFDWEAYARLD